MTARPAIDLAAPQRVTADPRQSGFAGRTEYAQRITSTPLQTHQGAWNITGRRCEPLDMRLPDSGWDMLQADLDAQHERTVRNWLIVDAIAAATLVGVLAALFAGWI